MLVCRGEVRESGLTGLTRNQVSLTAPGVRIPPSPPISLACFPTFWRSDEIGAWGAIHARRWTRRLPTAVHNANSARFVSVAIKFGATRKVQPELIASNRLVRKKTLLCIPFGREASVIL